MDMNRFFAQISSSLNYFEEAVGSQSPIMHSEDPLLKPPGAEVHLRQSSDTMSIEEDINSFSRESNSKYKCFKCSGLQPPLEPPCQEC